MSISTAEILRTLLKSPLTVGQLEGGFAKHSDDSEDDGHAINKMDTSQTDMNEGNTDDLLELKIKDPTFNPTPNNKLTIEQQELIKQFELMKYRLEQFKDILRQKGYDVSSYSVSMKNGRISFHISNHEHLQLFLSKFAKQIESPEVESPKRKMRMS